VVKNPVKSIIYAILSLLSWIIIPAACCFFATQVFSGMVRSVFYYLGLFSPLSLFASLEKKTIFQFEVYQILIACICFLILGLFFRYKCFSKADEYLGRGDKLPMVLPDQAELSKEN